MKAKQAVVILVAQDGKYLSVPRKDSDKFGLPGGKVEPGEDLEAAAARELREETGVICSQFILCFEQLVEGRTYGTDYETYCYLAVDPKIPDVLGGDVGQPVFLTADELASNSMGAFPRFNRKAIENAKKYM